MLLFRFLHVPLRFLKMRDKDLVGGTVDKNPPAGAGNVGLIPGLERFHVLWSS